MEAIARRTLVALLFAPPQESIQSVLASMATSLSAGNISSFIAATAKDLPLRDELRQQLAGLVAAYDLSCSIQLQTSSGSEEQQTAQVDWYLAGRSKFDDTVALQRREVLKITFAMRDKRWRVTSLEPRTIFDPK